MYQNDKIELPAYFEILPFFAFGCIFQGFGVGITLLILLSEVDVFSAIVSAIASIFIGFVFAAFIYAFSALVSSNLKMCALLEQANKVQNNSIAAAKKKLRSTSNLPEEAAAEDLESLGYSVKPHGDDQWEVISKLGTQVMSSGQLIILAKHKFHE